MFLSNFIKQCALQPRRLFLLDGIGALVSAFMLGVVLVRFNESIGIPVNTLYFLAFLPCLFAIYDAFIYFKATDPSRRSLKLIAYINIAYCFLSLGLALYHKESLTDLGWIYIIVEILIVMLIARVELKASQPH